MLPSAVDKNNQGFTILEQTIIMVILGILAAISAPSLWGMYNRFKVSDAINQLRSAFQEAQRQAVKKNEDCTVTLPTTGTSNPTIQISCTSDRTLDDVTIRHNYSLTSSNAITFNHKGETNNQGTIVLHIPNIYSQKCLVTSKGIGLMRSGNYDEADTTGATAGNCTTSQ